MHGARLPAGASPQEPRHRIDYVALPQASLMSVGLQGVDPAIDLSVRADDRFFVRADMTSAQSLASESAPAWPHIPPRSE